jgi:nicotinamidase-related amidase
MENLTVPHFESCALITIDTQVDTLDGGPLEIPGTSAALPNIAALCEAFRNARRPVVHVLRLYEEDGANAELCRRELVGGATPLLRRGTPGRNLAPGLLDAEVSLDDSLLLAGGIQPLGDFDVAIFKPRWGAFFHTPLDDYLAGAGVDTLVFAGCNFPNCPRTSIYEASERDYRIVLAQDAISGLYERGQDEMLNIGVHPLKTAEILAALWQVAPSTVARTTA